MNQEKLEKIIGRHQHYLNQDCEGWKTMKADLSGTNLRGTNLRYANLRGANLRGANLRGTVLEGADLIETNLVGADLTRANLTRANLTGANLTRADLIGADLTWADLTRADLTGTVLNDNKMRKGFKVKEPLIGWKKCRDDVLVQLEIPRGAIVFSINGAKCRTDKAKVIEVIGADRAFSTFSHRYLSYYPGDYIEVFNFNCEYNIECAKGIHFFMTKEEAEEYRP